MSSTILTSIMFVVIIQRSTSQLLAISSQDETMRLSLAKCIATASEKNFQPLEVITISLGPTSSETSYSQSSSLDAMLLPELFNKLKWSLLLKQPSRGRPSFLYFTYLSFTKSDSYVIQLRSWTEIDLHLTYIKRHPSWNPHAKFIIFSATIYHNEEVMLEYIIRKLWKVDVLNGVILIPDKVNPMVFNIYSWFPFADGGCGDKFNKLLLIDSCIDGVMSKNNEWFPTKIPNKLNNCSVHVRTLDYPPYIVNPVRLGQTPFYHIRKGLEAQLLNMVANTCNLYMKYEIRANDSVGDVNRHTNQSTGLIGALVRGEADIAVASLSATWQRFSKLDSTSAYFQDSLGFCVPHADETSQWDKLSGIMTAETWVAVGFTVIVFSVITTLLSHPSINTPESKVYTDQASVCQKIIAVAIGSAINLQPKTTQVRLFLMLWIIFSLHLDTAYQTYLMSALTNVEYDYQIRTVDDILGSDLELLFRPQDMKYFEASSRTKQAKEITARWKQCDDLDECLRRTAYRKDSVIAASRLYIQYAKASYLSKTGLPLLYCLQEQIVSFPVVAYMRHGFALQHKFDTVINMINSGGYIQRFEQDLFQEKKFAGGFKNESYQEDDFLDVDHSNKLLTFEHIKPCFFLLGGGYLIGVVLFGLEFVYFKYGRFGMFGCKKR